MPNKGHEAKIWQASCEANQKAAHCDYEVWVPIDIVDLNITADQARSKAANIQKTTRRSSE